MHALTFERFGGPDVLAWREVPDPHVGPGQVLVRLVSARVRRERAAELFDEVTSGRLRVRIAARSALRDGAAAHRFLESRAAIGKVLLAV